MKMTNRQYFCIQFDPAIVDISIEWSEVQFNGASEPAFGRLENVSYGQKHDFPVIKTNDGFMWIAMAGTKPDGGLERFDSGKVVLCISAKANDPEDAGIKFSISADSRTIGSVENLRHDRITFTITDGNVDVQFSMSKPVVRFKSKSADNDAPSSSEDVLRNLRTDLKILEFYRPYDTDGAVAAGLEAAISAIETGQQADVEEIYALEAKIAEFISTKTNIVHKYKTSVG